MQAILGGVLIGIAVSAMLLFNGKIIGISGILGSILNRQIAFNEKYWRILFITGLMVGGIILKNISPHSFTLISTATTIDYIMAGFLVGFGTLMGNGCTSGHGVCGISRLSIRSIIATCVFILSGMASVALFKIFRGEV